MFFQSLTILSRSFGSTSAFAEVGNKLASEEQKIKESYESRKGLDRVSSAVYDWGLYCDVLHPHVPHVIDIALLLVELH